MTSKSPQQPEEPETLPTFLDRLLAAIVAPIVFNLAIFIVYAAMFRYIRGPGAFAFAFVSAPLTLSVLAVSVIVSVIIGFAFGTRRFVTFLGHSFYTNNPRDRDWRVTVAIWATIFGLAYLLMH